MDIILADSTEEMDTYFKTIREYMSKVEIKKLTEELKKASDSKKKEIAQKIVEIKKKESI